MPSAGVLLAVLDGLQLQWLLDPQAVDMTADFHSLVRALLEAPTKP
jgi:hypothetical protein